MEIEKTKSALDRRRQQNCKELNAAGGPGLNQISGIFLPNAYNFLVNVSDSTNDPSTTYSTDTERALYTYAILVNLANQL